MKRVSLEELLESGLVEDCPANPAEARKLIQLSERDLKAASDNFESKNYAWTLAISYNAMLQSTRAVMQKKGYRPRGANKHVSIVRFAHAMLSGQVGGRLLSVFNHMRIKRHQAVYEEPTIVSGEEASHALESAKEFVREVKAFLG